MSTDPNQKYEEGPSSREEIEYNFSKLLEARRSKECSLNTEEEYEGSDYFKLS